MDLKKTIAFISALAVSGSALVSNGISAFADEDERQFETGSLPTFIYTMDNQTEINCRIYEDMPSIPYIRFSDYYKCWTEQDAEIVNNGDGTYTVTVPTGAKAVIDVNKDTLSTDEFAYFTGVQSEIEGTDDMLNIFVKDVQSEAVEYDEKPVTIDFSNYSIDITGDENDIWFPAPTLCDIFMGSIHSAVYFGGGLFFCNNLAGDLSVFSFSAPAYTLGYFDMYAENGRPQDLAEYNYNELCLVIDLEYGYPGRIALEDTLREKGLDGMLSESNADTQLVKKHLLSVNPYEYLAGLEELGMYMDDGGHTAFATYFESVIPEENLKDYITNLMPYFKEDFSYEGASFIDDKTPSYLGVLNGREKLFVEAGENVMSFLDGSVYFAVKGDTAVFGFDEFNLDLEGWGNYYNNGGEIPEDVISIFYNCVSMANEDPEIKNFVIDLGLNGGGVSAIEFYMMSLIADDNSTLMHDVRNDITGTSYFEVDKNLDGVFDEKDKELKFDLNFAVISSQISFSCANLMVSDARDNGILVIGEQSGGGACAIQYYMLPDGQIYQFSTASLLVDKNGESIDAGITPDFITTEKAVIDFMGQPMEINDFTSAYSFEGLSEMFASFYSNETKVMKGDVTGDGIIDATDASAILTAYAEESVGKISGFTKEQKNLADVNNDGIFDAADASAVLTFYAKSSAGYTGTFEEFLAEQAA